MSAFGKFMLGLLIGGGVGAAVGLLMAPRRGEETRAYIRNEFEHKYNDSVSAINDSVSAVKGKAEDLKSKAKKLSAELEEAGRRVVGKVAEHAPE